MRKIVGAKMDKRLLFIIIALFVFSYLHRYEIVTTNEFGYLLDRWTGEIKLLASNRMINLKEED